MDKNPVYLFLMFIPFTLQVIIFATLAYKIEKDSERRIKQIEEDAEKRRYWLLGIKN